MRDTEATVGIIWWLMAKNTNMLEDAGKAHFHLSHEDKQCFYQSRSLTRFAAVI